MINLVERLRSQLKKRLDIYLSRVSSGSVSSFDEYRYLCGIIHSFKECEEIINKTYRSMFEIGESLAEQDEGDDNL